MKKIIFLLIISSSLIASVFSQEMETEYHFHQYTGVVAGDELLTRSFIFPQISGIKNADLEKKLNAGFRMELDFFLASPAPFGQVNYSGIDTGVFLTAYVDSGHTLNFPLDDSKLITITVLEKKPENWTTMSSTITIELISEKYLNISNTEMLEGNMAANFLRERTVLDLHAEKNLILADLWQGDYLDIIRKNLYQNTEIQDSCGFFPIKRVWADRMVPTTPISFIAEDFIGFQTDKRNFMCSEVDRGPIEFTVPLKDLEKYQSK